MPRYDHRCVSCGYTVEAFAAAGKHPPCAKCGHDTEYVWLSKAPDVIGDEAEIYTEHGWKTPRRFRSRSEWRRAMQEAGIRPYDKFTPVAGTDKPRIGGITKSLPPMDADYQAWLADKLASGKAMKEPELPKLHIRTDVRELTTREYEAVRDGR